MAAAQQGRIHGVRSSLAYQIILYLNRWYFGFFFIAEILGYIFKAETLPYASTVLASEVVLLFLLAGIEAIRLFFGERGNLTEKVGGVVVCVVLSIPALFGALFLILWQTYVLRVEVILAAIQLSFIGLELIFSIVSIITFSRVPPP